MAIIVLFGLPGAGKTYVGEILRDQYGYYLHDGDQDIPEQMKKLIDQSLPITDDLRDEFFQNLITHVQQLEKEHTHIVVAQTFIKEKYRLWMLEAFPNATFVLIEAEESIRERRLRERKQYPLDISYAMKMTHFFETPLITHLVIKNNQNGINPYLPVQLDT